MSVSLRFTASTTGTRGAAGGGGTTTPSTPWVDPTANMGGGPNLIQRSLFSTDTPLLDYSTWYTPGTGSPAVSTSDYYLMNGIWRARPYDLDTMGTDGATIKAREGFRYVWMMGCDHPSNGETLQASSDFYVGYSNDPQVWPASVKMLRRQEQSITVVDEFSYSQASFFVYHFPYLVYNPDSAGDKFWIYAEGQSASSSRQHELALMTTPDFLTTTLVGPVIATTTFGGGTSIGYVRRNGTGNWEAWSYGTRSSWSFYYHYTSTDGLVWTTPGTVIGDGSSNTAGAGEYTDISGQKYLLEKEGRSDNDYISLLPVDSSYVATGGARTRISTAFNLSVGDPSYYPGPTYLQDVWGYEEDGVMSIYASRGFFGSNLTNALNKGPSLGLYPTRINITGTLATGAGNTGTLTVTSNPGGYALLPGFQLLFLANGPAITADNHDGTYAVAGGGPLSAISTPTSIPMSRNGGLWHQFVDQYYYVTNAATAAAAAPLGVTADCVSNTVTVSWNDCLPNRTYRVYKGSSSGTQATLVGDVTGISITDTPTSNQQWFYKVVTMQGATERKSRVVNCYVSNNSMMVNRHVNRVKNDGGDTTKIDMTFLASVDAYLSGMNYYRYLMHWVDVRFGIKLDGSSNIAKIYCLGTTRMPRGGDYTPTTSNTYPSTSSGTTYSATGWLGTTPAWVNGSTTAIGYFGNGRANNFQRKNEITLIAAYQKPGTAVGTLFGYGQGAGLYLTHASGASGNVTFGLSDIVNPPGTYKTATVPFTLATGPHVAAAIHDGFTMTAYLDGVAGTPTDSSAFNNPGLTKDTTLRGLYTSLQASGPALISGSNNCKQTFLTRAYSYSGSEALFTCAALVIFEKALPNAVAMVGQMYNPVNENIVTNYGADNTGVADAATKFNDFHTARANDARPFTLTVPSGNYTMSSNLAQTFSKDVKNLIVKGAGIDITNITRVNPSANTYKWGEEGLFQDGLHSAKVQTIAAGATSATLTTAAASAGYISRFSVGQRCLLAGIDLQASGDPFNDHFFEYLKILSIAGNTITFTSAVKDTYKDTWPAYNDGTLGGGNGMDQGGAATLYALRSGCDCDFTIQDMTLIAGSGVTDNLGQNGGRNCILKNVKISFPSQIYAWAPSATEISTMINVNIDKQVEVDKSIGTFNIVGGYVHKIYAQSSSVGLLYVSGGALIDQLGTVRRNLIENSTIARLDIGPGYGVTESIEINNSVVQAFNPGGPSPTYNIATLGYTCAGGLMQRVIPTPQNQKMESWAVPGTWIRFLNASGSWLASAKVIDLYRDTTNNYIQTSLPGGFPAGATNFVQHICANFKARNSTGCAEMLDHSQAGAQGKPLFSYINRTYDKTLLPSPTGVPKPLVWGAIVSIKVNVQTPYTGAGTLIWSYDQFHNSSNIIRADGVTTLLCDIRVDAKVAGARTLTPTGNTFEFGAKPTSDVWPTLTVGDKFVTTANTGPTLSVDVSAQNVGPVIVLEIICDQGIS